MIKLPENENDLQNLIDDKVVEDIHLDYKASDSLNNNDEISKDVSAFANSDGGIIIYGIEEDKNSRTFSIMGVNTKGINQKERLGQIIGSKITPKINGIKINEIKLKDGNFVYAVEIPKSILAPHQCIKDKKYYKRYDSQSAPMEHYEIEDVRNRCHRILPLVNIDIEIQATPLVLSSKEGAMIGGGMVIFVISNQGDGIAENVKFSTSESTKNQLERVNGGDLPSIFRRGLELFHPQKTYKFKYGLRDDIINNEKLKKTSIEARYFHPQSYSEKVEQFDFNLEDLLGISMEEESDLIKLTKTLQKNLEELKKILGSSNEIWKTNEKLLGSLKRAIEERKI